MAPFWTCKHNSCQSVHIMKNSILLYLFSVSTVLVTPDFSMETIQAPLHLDGTQWFLPDQANENCCRMLPEWVFEASQTLVGALTQLFELTEEDLQLKVCDVFLQDDRTVQITIEQ